MGQRTVTPRGYVWRKQTFTANGNFTIPATLQGDSIFVTGCGGGGGGASGAASVSGSVVSQYYASGGSGAGGVMQYPVCVSGVTTVNVFIGAGGSGGTAVTRSTGGATTGNSGSNGGPTYLTFDSTGPARLWLFAGLGGVYDTNLTSAQIPQVVENWCEGGYGGGTSSSGAGEAVGPQLGGALGTPGSSYALAGCGGGASFLSAGGGGGDGAYGTAPQTADDGDTPAGWGAGGGGGGTSCTSNTGSSTSGAGGDGADGVLIIEWLERAT